MWTSTGKTALCHLPARRFELQMPDVCLEGSFKGPGNGLRPGERHRATFPVDAVSFKRWKFAQGVASGGPVCGLRLGSSSAPLSRATLWASHAGDTSGSL